MKLSIDATSAANVVRGYGAGVVRIGAREVAGSLIVSATTLLENWRPRSMAELTVDDLEPALALAPEVLLIGSGTRQIFPPPDVLAALHRARVGFEVMATGAACRTYNVLVAEGREVAAALIVERD